MMKKLLITILLLNIGLINNSFGNMEQRREQLINIIDEELREVIRLNRQIGSKNPNLLLRMAELYLEKARLIIEEENYKWLSISPEESAKMDQKDFYKKSRQYFLMAQKTCYYILKRFKKFKGRAEVYYILAYNAKEFQQGERAKKFFQRAIKFAKSGSYTEIKSKLALGEMYYNEKKYKEAIPLYETALKRRDQKWWTKDAYNLAWCYFRVNERSKAINLMSEVHKLSGNASFIDVSEQVERDLAYFYSEAGRTNEALAFYKKIGKDIGKNFLKVGKYLKGQGKYAAAQSAFDQAAKNAESDDVKIEVYVELLSLYDRFGKVDKHLAVSKFLFEKHKANQLNPKQLEDLKYHVAKMSAQLQKQVVSKAYNSRNNIKRQKAALATEYFQIQAGLSDGIDHKAIFHAAETQYSVKDFNKAANLYDQAYEVSKKVGDSKIEALALDGLLASLNGKGVSEATTNKYLSKSYAIFLKKNPRSKKSFKIYQRLFNSKIQANDIKGAENTLLEFKFHFPDSQQKQEVMLARVMDYHRVKKDREEIKKWVDKINSGEFKVSQKFAKKLRLILLSIQFDKVEKFNTKGEKVDALKGYLEIYKDASSSEDARKSAAYNIATLFHQLGNKEKTYGWSKRALSLLDPKDVDKYEDSFLLMASGLFNYREFRKSAEIYEITLEKVCKLRAKNKDTFYKNANILYLADGNLQKAVEVIELGKSCGISDKIELEVALDTLTELGKQERWQSFENLLNKLKGNVSASSDLIYPMSKLRKTFFARGRKDQAVSANIEMINLFKRARARKQRIPLEALDVIAENYLEDLRRTAEKLESIRLTFPEKEYNGLLKAKFKYLDSVTSKALDVFKIGSGHGIVEGYRILVESYKKLGKEIADFAPEGKSGEYIASFRNSMKDIALPIMRKAEEFESEAIKQINSSKILSLSNFYFLSKNNLPVVPQFFPVKNGVLMDRGGKK
ncbi:MAG: hypothetical protein K9K67_01480 [Bacteriovoracaceae bacterium]|nr:hypothetical protein [Bacteriovoracaceae bacterium]